MRGESPKSVTLECNRVQCSCLETRRSPAEAAVEASTGTLSPRSKPTATKAFTKTLTTPKEHSTVSESASSVKKATTLRKFWTLPTSKKCQKTSLLQSALKKTTLVTRRTVTWSLVGTSTHRASLIQVSVFSKVKNFNSKPTLR